MSVRVSASEQAKKEKWTHRYDRLRRLRWYIQLIVGKPWSGCTGGTRNGRGFFNLRRGVSRRRRLGVLLLSWMRVTSPPIHFRSFTFLRCLLITSSRGRRDICRSGPLQPFIRLLRNGRSVSALAIIAALSRGFNSSRFWCSTSGFEGLDMSLPSLSLQLPLLARFLLRHLEDGLDLRNLLLAGPPANAGKGFLFVRINAFGFAKFALIEQEIDADIPPTA